MHQTKREIVVGINPICEAIKSGRKIESVYYCRSKKGMEDIVDLSKKNGIPLKKVNKQSLHKFADINQGIVATVSAIEFVDLDLFLKRIASQKKDPFIIICDSIEDPHNLGAIIRTADAVKADGVIIQNRRSATITPVVQKSSAGAVSFVPIIRVVNINSAIKMLKQNGIWVFGTHISGEDFTKVDLKGAIAIVLGSESNGISKLVMKNCDKLLKIPMLGNINSLNVSVAAGIVMYEALRQRF